MLTFSVIIGIHDKGLVTACPPPPKKQTLKTMEMQENARKLLHSKHENYVPAKLVVQYSAEWAPSCQK
jgi:hypothetical protein